MKQHYLKPVKNFFSLSIKSIALIAILLIGYSTRAQGLIFENPVLESGNAGNDGAVYRFPNVAANLDALVKINGRSSTKVVLENLDLATTGWSKAFQPQVSYRNRTAYGERDWWMEFEISFVAFNTSVPVIISNLDLTAIDVDGDGNDVNEWVSLYNMKTYTVERFSSLSISDILESVLNVLTPTGKKFTGPVANYDNIDTSATRVMASAKYENRGQIRIRTGGQSSDRNISANRMYSFWFKSFTYQAPVQSPLPVTLSAFTAKRTDAHVILNWTTEAEKDVSHFVVERSFNGTDFTNTAVIFTDGNANTRREYSFTDDLKNINSPILYYRLKMVDLDGTYKYSAVRIIRVGSDKERTDRILVYPNPAVNEVRITLPVLWQDKPLTIQVINSNGQPVKNVVTSRAGQTETFTINNLPAGLYVIKASNGTEVATQQLIKSK